MSFARTSLLKAALTVGLMAGVAASGSASARIPWDPFKMCCVPYVCFPCFDVNMPAGPINDLGQGQSLQIPLLAIVEDHDAWQSESPQEDFGGVPYRS